MSFLSTVRTSIAPRVALRPAYTAVSGFHSSPARAALNESDHSSFSPSSSSAPRQSPSEEMELANSSPPTDRDNLDSYYEAEKQDQLKSTKEGNAKWKGGLASNSEASVKADRGEVDSDDKDFSSLQDRTKGLPNRSGSVNKTQ
ncbi:uncharacterized protein ACLA_074760 [Aspergillus clavatus NRRL 1]|uniref:Uncharacterized protein n=1 Tax=Aspergillus clavatus (strain ATCC 1007 / CBS 513.65 / DSM 816 / NCTC 3887 / NRRL 1 / QM 1276 / 107) TaxID=344612 RepID=A1C7R8_ASPCL|nr:uncharacterized protein ACLA_074760 [Aspergillus clavatus NRRL 1]EAW14439.1 conserved hypothetical protein [Aspergillus clavatus NRRL 1]